jgi:class I lanthipeptide synthase
MTVPLLGASSAARAHAIATEIGMRIADPETFDAAFERLPAGHRSVADLAFGYPGPALLASALAECAGEAGWDEIAHRYLARAFAAESGSNGLYAGHGGLLFAMNVRARRDPRYLTVAQPLAGRLAEFERSLMDETPVLRIPADYDIIGGVAGTLLAVAPHDAAFRDAALEFFERLAASEDPATWTVENPFEPDRYVDYGAAHGLSGVLGAVCAVTAPDERTVLKRRLIALVLAAAVPADPVPGAVRWPSKVGSAPRQLPYPGWCYGVPGVAAILWMAAGQVGDGAAQRVALEAFERVARGTPAENALLDHGLCHGTAGAAALAGALARASGSAVLAAFAARLADEVIAAFEPATAFGYRAIIAGEPVDNRGFLTGAAGIGLALLGLCGRTDPPWLQALGVPVALTDTSGRC